MITKWSSFADKCLNKGWMRGASNQLEVERIELSSLANSDIDHYMLSALYLSSFLCRAPH